MATLRVVRPLLFLIVAVLAVPLLAQQTGAINGKVMAADGSSLPGVTVEARSKVLPQPRVATTDENGEYRLPQLVPGAYTVEFTLSGMQPVTRRVEVLLQQEARVNATLAMAGLTENITVTAEASYVDPTSASIRTAISEQEIERLPVGQEYRDLIKLIPGVQYTEMTIRGPSAGGSGQDNMYQFDGVNVTLPLFGVLSTDPSSHDIAQVSTIKGGAKAIDFNRAGGFTIDSVSKSGTSEFTGEVGYQLQTPATTWDLKTGAASQYDETKAWASANLGGPIIRDRLLFYGSYYRPTVDRTKRSNLYGELPDYNTTRNEYFGKLTYTPTSAILLNGSYRDSGREGTAESIAPAGTASTASHSDSTLKIGIGEASWVVNGSSYATFKYNDFKNESATRPDVVLPGLASVTPGAHLDVNDLANMGLLLVPSPISGNTAFNTFIQPIIDKYGFVRDGARVGGGTVGAYNSNTNAPTAFDDSNYYRTSYQAGYNLTVGSRIAHDLHVGFQWSKDSEDIVRSSNGWGRITVVGGRTNCTAAVCGTVQPISYTARFLRSTLGVLASPKIHSEIVSENLELNDTIRWNDFSFNVGVLVSEDTLYGQGLTPADNIAGFVLAPGNKYKMHTMDWQDQIQPRLGVTWAYNGTDTVYASFAKYNPPANSLARAASWDRNQFNLAYDVHFNANGDFIGFQPVASSSGKLFQEGIKPRYTDEYLVGTARQFNQAWSARMYGRYRYSGRFWEDTNNDSAQLWAPQGFNKGLYIPDLDAKRLAIGGGTTRSGSTYVIAQLEGAFTKYYEATLESDWRSGANTVTGSYTWSHYYGNFDQDNTSPGGNDFASFIGSSFIADGAGTMIWDNKYGDLRGDRRHLLKVNAIHDLPWNASTGIVAIYQSGEPWEIWNYEPYQNLPGFSGLNDTNRYGEPAGRRRTDSHYQVDLQYAQRFSFGKYGLHVVGDLYNLFDRQTGYNVNPQFHSATFGQARSFYAPRKFQLSARFLF
jgi:hypothetical protein